MRKVYKLLLSAFGPQGWWPLTRLPAPGPKRPAKAYPGGDGAAPPCKYLPVYSPGLYGPPSSGGMFEICVGAILTQNTSWKNVEKALGALNRARMLSPEKIKACPGPGLAALIRPSGYYRQKAVRLKLFCSYILRAHPEGLKKWFSAAQRSALRLELLSLKGIGPETADSMLLYAAGKPSFVIDAYTRRISRRFGIGGDLPYERWQELFEVNLPPDVKMYNEYHALLVKLGKDFCKKKEPRCNDCPLGKLCNAETDRKGKKTAGR